jgi:hypothetical protein
MCIEVENRVIPRLGILAKGARWDLFGQNWGKKPVGDTQLR